MQSAAVFTEIEVPVRPQTVRQVLRRPAHQPSHGHHDQNVAALSRFHPVDENRVHEELGLLCHRLDLDLANETQLIFVEPHGQKRPAVDRHSFKQVNIRKGKTIGLQGKHPGRARVSDARLNQPSLLREQGHEKPPPNY